MAAIQTTKPSYLWGVLNNKCPRCRKGDLFITQNPYDIKHNLVMHSHCPVCNQPTDIEVGFYYGTGYVSYALSVGFLVLTFIAWKLFIGLTFSDNSIFWWLGTSILLLVLLQPIFMRLSRTLWLSWFVKYEPRWKDHKPDEGERVVKEHMGNW